MDFENARLLLLLYEQLQRRSEQMKKNLEQQEKEMEEKIRAFESERDAWEEQNKQFDEQWVKQQLSLHDSRRLSLFSSFAFYSLNA